MKQYIKETRFYHHTFLFYVRWLAFHEHCAKNFKTYQNNVSIPKMDEKKLHTREFQLKGIGRNMRRNLLQKRSAVKTTECSKHLRHIATEKDIFSELTRCIFQISLKYIKLVIPEILFILVYWYYEILIFTSKLRDPHNKITPHQKKISDTPSPSAKTFQKVFDFCMPFRK